MTLYFIFGILLDILLLAVCNQHRTLRLFFHIRGSALTELHSDESLRHHSRRALLCAHTLRIRILPENLSCADMLFC